VQRRVLRERSFGVAVSLCLGLLSATADAAPALASAGQLTIVEAYEMRRGDDRLVEATFDEWRELGGDVARILVYWRDIAPDPASTERPDFDAADPNAYPAESWRALDRFVRESRERGFLTLMTVSGPGPRWASKSGSQVNDPDPAEFRLLMRALGARYRDDVDWWGIWNEPNVESFLGPQTKNGEPYSPVLYRSLFTEGRKGLEASGNADDVILIGETSPQGSGRALDPLTFTRGVLCLLPGQLGDCPRFDADGWAHHPYSPGLAPFRTPPDPGDISAGSLDRLTTALDRAALAGTVPEGLPVYLTEFAIQSVPDPYIGVSLQQQAEFRSIAEYLAWKNPRVMAFSQYLMRDDPPYNSKLIYGGFESGLRTSDGLPKPSYPGFRLPLIADRAAGEFAVWGYVRPRHRGDQTQPIGSAQAPVQRCPESDPGQPDYAGAAAILASAPAAFKRAARGALRETLLAHGPFTLRPPERVTVQVRVPPARSWRELTTAVADSAGYWSASVPDPGPRALLRVCWTDPEGSVFLGPETRAYPLP
jgi:hypothetical protein